VDPSICILAKPLISIIKSPEKKKKNAKIIKTKNMMNNHHLIDYVFLHLLLHVRLLPPHGPLPEQASTIQMYNGRARARAHTAARSPPLVLASEHEAEVEEDPEEETPSHGHEQALPLSELRHRHLMQDAAARDDARVGADPDPERRADGRQHPCLDGVRQRRQRGVVEDLRAPHEALAAAGELVLQHALERVLDQRQVVEPDPVGRDPVPVDEEAAEEQEVGEDGHHHGVPDHHVRYHAGEERDEAAPRPERRQDGQRVEGEPGHAAREADGEEGGECEGEGEHHERREGDDGVGQHVGGAPVRAVGRLPQEHVALVEEHRQRVGAGVEHGGHGEREEAQPLLRSLGGLVQPEEDGGEDRARDHHGCEAYEEQLGHPPRVDR